MDLLIDFVTNFAPDYEIAARSSAFKTNTVRCFPSCGENGHRDGFCGSTVISSIIMRVGTLEENAEQQQDFQMEQALIVGEIQPLGRIDTDSIQDHCSESEVRMNAMGKKAKYALGKITSSTSTDSILFEYEVVFEIRPWAYKAPEKIPTNGKGVDYVFVVSILWPDSLSLSHLRILARMVSPPFAFNKKRKTGIPPLPPTLQLKRPRDEPELPFERRRSNSFSSSKSGSDDESLYCGTPSSFSRSSSTDDCLTTCSSVSGVIDGLEEDFKLFDIDDNDDDADFWADLLRN